MISWAAEPPIQKKSELALTIETQKSVVKSSEGVSFTLSFHNHGSNNLLLNGGEMLGNGSEIWSSLEAELKSETGERIPMTLSWGVAGVAGRFYFLGVPLRAGSDYKLSVNPRDYLIGNGERLKPGKYEVRFLYRGRESSFRDTAEMPVCWEGEVQSNTLRFEVIAE